ncbi:hypothetical protein HHL17_16690 [Chitinophaga sp. G-6-1-13]|uniref:Uncharacterized protein n=1 Tax=Chitinophaga fulva TaxID=2728842 RepID=A0A848GKJ5_9BACT|nr:hypothetical protein [Chitinophaga fulva]NML38846.1 hypothetical protein [Chitinophaga fulva]
MDMFTLEGIRPLKPPFVYPYVIIKSQNNNEKDISYHTDSKTVRSYHYEKIGNYWRTIYSQVGNISRECTYEYVMPDKIVSLNYWINPKNKVSYLKEVSVFKKWEEENFLMGKGLTIKPDVSLPDRVRAQASGAVAQKIQMKNGVLRMERTIYNEKGKEIHRNVTCYRIGNKSYFAWRYLYADKEEIKCE